MDGMMARRYNMVSKFGDIFEHSRDILGGFVLSVMAYHKYHAVIPWVIYPLAATLTLGTAMHIGCQQKYVARKDPNSSPDSTNESINFLTHFCPSVDAIAWTRYLGAGTFNVSFALILLYLHMRQ
jgi:phosphatidylglycerophosphate synthase